LIAAKHYMIMCVLSNQPTLSTEKHMQ